MIRGRVHAVFPTALYVATRGAPFLVIHDAAHGHTPTSLLVAHARPATWGIAVGMDVVGRNAHMRVGAMLLDLRHARAWRTPAPSVRAVAIAAAPFAAWIVDVAAEAAGRLDPACRRLAAALADDDAAGVAAGCRALIGAGPGLTPSGDDALIGILAVLHRAGPAGMTAAPRACLRSAIRPLLERTTPISAHFLRLACDGHFGENLTNLLDDVGPLGNVRPDLLAKVLATGATSGADTLVGIATGLRLVEDLAATHRHRDAA